MRSPEQWTTLLATPGPLTWPLCPGHIGTLSVTTPRETGLLRKPGSTLRSLYLGPDRPPYCRMLRGLEEGPSGQGDSPCKQCDSSAPPQVVAVEIVVVAYDYPGGSHHAPDMMTGMGVPGRSSLC